MKSVLEAGRPGLEAAVDHMKSSFNINFPIFSPHFQKGKFYEVYPPLVLMS